MKIVIGCKRGNVAERDKFGHCLCADCKAFRYERAQTPQKRAYRAEWAAKNKEKVAAYSKKWAAQNVEKRREIERSWKERNPEKAAEYSAKAGKKWSQINKGKRLSSVRSRQLAKLLRTPAWADIARIEEMYRLSQEMTEKTGIKHEVDHVLPLQGATVSGLHVHQNLRVITRKENRSKGNKVCEC